MRMMPKQPTVKAPAETFIGDAWFDVVARGEAPSRVRVNVVRFAPAKLNLTLTSELPGNVLTLSLDKCLTKMVLASQGIDMPRGRLVTLRDLAQAFEHQ